MNRASFVYILTNQNNNVLYIGVTNDIERRIVEHKKGINKGFTEKYKLKKLVYFEEFASIKDAIAREKQLKNWHRSWKMELITFANKEWRDLSDEWF